MSEKLLKLKEINKDIFIGNSGNFGSLGQWYGGHIMAQGMRAASFTVPNTSFMTSFHCKFLSSARRNNKYTFHSSIFFCFSIEFTKLCISNNQRS